MNDSRHNFSLPPGYAVWHRIEVVCGEVRLKKIVFYHRGHRGAQSFFIRVKYKSIYDFSLCTSVISVVQKK